MPSLQSISDPKVYHILTYGALLGSNVMNTFLSGPIAYKCLPRAQFSTLQQNIFPPYFSFQTALPLILALTWPGDSLVGGAGGNVGAIRNGAGWRGLISGEGSFWSGLVPFGIMFGTSLLNLLVLGPATTKVMKERKHQETRDGKRYTESPKSAEMERLNSAFSKLHGVSAVTNLVGLVSMLYYGVVLAEKL